MNVNIGLLELYVIWHLLLCVNSSGYYPSCPCINQDGKVVDFEEAAERAMTQHSCPHGSNLVNDECRCGVLVCSKLEGEKCGERYGTCKHGLECVSIDDVKLCRPTQKRGCDVTTSYKSDVFNGVIPVDIDGSDRCIYRFVSRPDQRVMVTITYNPLEILEGDHCTPQLKVRNIRPDRYVLRSICHGNQLEEFPKKIVSDSNRIQIVYQTKHAHLRGSVEMKYEFVYHEKVDFNVQQTESRNVAYLEIPGIDDKLGTSDCPCIGHDGQLAAFTCEPKQCPAGSRSILDPCNCGCHVCSKVVGESCGGPLGIFGTCSDTLLCVGPKGVIHNGGYDSPKGVCKLPRDCGATISKGGLSRGIIMDSFDGSETYCIYRFNAPPGYRVFLRILSIDMFPRMDQQRLCQPRLNVRDIDDDGSRLFLRSYCSQSELHVAETIISVSSRIQVVYRGPSSRSGKFEVRYEFVPDDNYETEQTRDLKGLPSPSFSEPCETIPCFKLCQDGELLKDERDCTICECRAEQDYKFWMPRCRIVENDILEKIQQSEHHLRPPTCDQDGHFASVQCIDEKCFRVDKYTGDVIDEISAIDPRY